MELLIYLLTTFGIIGFFLWLIVDLLVFHQERGEKLAGWLAQFFTWTGRRAQKTATAMSIQGKINSFARSIDTEVRGLLPYGVKIQWISPSTNREAFIKQKQVVVMLDYHHNQDVNLSRAAVMYMNKAVIPEARPHIDKKLSHAIDLMMAKKALYSFTEARSVFDHFVSNVLRPKTSNDSDIKDFCEVIDLTDERGLFTRILLREILELGRSRAGASESGDTVYESTQFVKHLKKVAEKERGVDVNPNFYGSHVSVAIIFVAKPEKVDLGTSPYLNAIKKYGIDKSARVIYLFSRGDRNIEFARRVTHESLETYKNLEKMHEEEYPTKVDGGKVLTGYCAILFNRKTL